MAFRYINPGYVSLIDSNVTATEVTGTTYSKTGVGFTQTNSSAGVSIPNFAEGDEFWARFDAYIPSATAINLYLLVPTSDSGIRVEINKSGGVWLYHKYSWNSSNTIAYGTGVAATLKFGAINTFVLHIKLGTSANATLEVSINGQSFSATGKDMIYRSRVSDVAIIYSSADNVIFSNVIMSSEEISPKEQVIALPTLVTETNMTAGESGLFIANAANQTLLQSVDVSELIESYGASSAVTGIALVGNPAYKTATGLTSLIGLSKGGTSIVEHGTCDLSDETDAVIVDGWTTENITIADIQDMQFGWKAGE